MAVFRVSVGHEKLCDKIEKEGTAFFLIFFFLVQNCFAISDETRSVRKTIVKI